MNAEITFDVSVCRPSIDESIAYADNVKFMAFNPPVYDQDIPVSMTVTQDGHKMRVIMSQDEFITMVRALNNEKNKLLKRRRMYDAEKKAET